MKRLLLLPILLGMSGCALTGPSPAQIIVQNQSEIQLASSLATNVAVMNIPVADRVSTAREIYEVAYAINSAVKGGNVDIAQVQALAQTLLSNWKSPYEVAAGSVVDLVFNYVQSDLTQYFANSNADIQKQAVIDLLTSASAGVMNTASLYTQGTPAFPEKVALHPTANATGIAVVHANWK